MNGLLIVSFINGAENVVESLRYVEGKSRLISQNILIDTRNARIFILKHSVLEIVKEKRR